MSIHTSQTETGTQGTYQVAHDHLLSDLRRDVKRRHLWRVRDARVHVRLDADQEEDALYVALLDRQVQEISPSVVQLQQLQSAIEYVFSMVNSTNYIPTINESTQVAQKVSNPWYFALLHWSDHLYLPI